MLQLITSVKRIHTSRGKPDSQTVEAFLKIITGALKNNKLDSLLDREDINIWEHGWGDEGERGQGMPEADRQTGEVGTVTG